MTNSNEQARRSVVDQITNFFVFGGPVNSRELLAGRHTELKQVDEALLHPGLQIAVYGEGAVGKTSLVLSAFRDKNSHRYECNASDTYASIFGHILNELGVFEVGEQSTKVSGSAKLSGHVVDLGANAERASKQQPFDVPLTPPRIVSLFADRQPVTYVIIDEFDRVLDQSTKQLMAETLKQFSDRKLATKLVIVGVADSLQALFSEHRSVSRALRAIKVPRMSGTELTELIDGRSERLDISFPQDIKSTIVLLSDGFAYYTHLLCSFACQEAVNEVLFNQWVPRLVEEGRRGLLGRLVGSGTSAAKQFEMTAGYLDKAVERALDFCCEGMGWQYEAAAGNRSSNDNQSYGRLLQACAKARSAPDAHWFTVEQIVGSLKADRARVARNANADERIRHMLEELCTGDRGTILQKGEGDQYRFTVPIMGGYIQLRRHAEIRGIPIKRG
jgi:hypothetical protein